MSLKHCKSFLSSGLKECKWTDWNWNWCQIIYCPFKQLWTASSLVSSFKERMCQLLEADASVGGRLGLCQFIDVYPLLFWPTSCQVGFSFVATCNSDVYVCFLEQLVEVKRVGEGSVSSRLLPIFVKHRNHSFMFSPVIISHIIQLSTTSVISWCISDKWRQL